MKQDFLAELSHSWGKSPEQKKRESEYNAEYYKKHKEKWQDNRPKAREKYVTAGGAGVEKGESINPGAVRKEKLALAQYAREELQREINNKIWLYEGKANNVGLMNLNAMRDLVEATKKSALINLKHGKIFSAAKDFVTAIKDERTVKEAAAYYETIKKPLRQFRVHNQHAIDEIARMNKNRKPEYYG